MNPPAVTVLMAVRDGARFLPETLASLSAMDAPSGGVEFVVIDDASADETPALLARWAEADGRVRIHRAEERLGLPRALNLGLADARAPLVARADADDLYAPDRLTRQASALGADARLGALGCGYARIDEAGTEIDRVVPPTGPETLKFRMLFMNPLLHPGVMFRTALVRDAGGYDPAYWTAQDSDLWARLSAVTRLDNLPEPLVRYRVHGTSIMKKRGPEGRSLSLTVPARLQAAYLGALPEDHDVAATVRLFQGFEPMQSRELRAGLAGLTRIRRAALLRETPVVLADFDHRARSSMLKYARWMKIRSPGTAMRLAAAVVTWRRETPPSNGAAG